MLLLLVSSQLKIAAYFAGTLFLGALLAPPLFWAGHALGAAWTPLHVLAEFGFRRYFDRAMFVAALLLLWPAVRGLRVTGWRDLGLERDPRRWRHVGFGFGAAAGLLWLMGLFLWWQGLYSPRPSLSVPWAALAAALITAAVIASLEEGFFRGALQGLIGRSASPIAALVFVSGLFAILHFLRPPEEATPPGDVTWWSGFTYLPRVFWQWGDLRLVLGGLVTLLAVGLVLGYARWRTRALWLSIGLHAGWVFGVKSYATVSRHTAANNVWFGEDLRHGVIPVVVVAVTGLLVVGVLRRESGEAS